MDVFWTPLAINDLEGIREFVQRDKPVAALSLVAGIFRTVESLSTMPQRGRPSRLGTRELVIGSYIVRYRVTENQVEVLRIRHGAQHWI